METSYLKAHPLGNRYPEWMPNLHSHHSQDSTQAVPLYDKTKMTDIAKSKKSDSNMKKKCLKMMTHRTLGVQGGTAEKCGGTERVNEGW